jgi:hypothetical protein
VDSNHRHGAYETPALPLSYAGTASPGILATSPTPSSRTRRSLADRGVTSDTRIVPETLPTRCSKCSKDFPTWALSLCKICGLAVCPKCQVFAYGRPFCSTGCAIFFFHGDSDEVEDEVERP